MDGLANGDDQGTCITGVVFGARGGFEATYLDLLPCSFCGKTKVVALAYNV